MASKMKKDRFKILYNENLIAGHCHLVIKDLETGISYMAIKDFGMTPLLDSFGKPAADKNVSGKKHSSISDLGKFLVGRKQDGTPQMMEVALKLLEQGIDHEAISNATKLDMAIIDALQLSKGQ